jgi:hypothetical protein
MLEEKSQIPELYYLKTRWNNNLNRHFPWEKNILIKTTSVRPWMNPNLNGYLTRLQDNVALMVETTNIVRNFFNVAVSKYYNDHWC